MPIINGCWGIEFSGIESPALEGAGEQKPASGTAPEPDPPAGVLPASAAAVAGGTSFFGDPDAFRVLEAELPRLFQGKTAGQGVRVWVAGCATGEEAYSVAMLLAERAARLASPPAFQVFATDLDEAALRVAREGLYPETIAADVSDERLRLFFSPDHGRYRVSRALRETVLFAAHDPRKDPPFSHLDLIWCPRLLGGWPAEAQRRALGRFSFGLRPEGRLWAGGLAAGAAEALFRPLGSGRSLHVRQPPEVPGPAGAALAKMAGPDNEGVEAADRTSLGKPLWSAAVTGKLVEMLGSGVVFIDRKHRILHCSARASCYLRPGAAEANCDLLRSIYPALRIALRTTLRRATETGAPAEASGVPLELGGRRRMINLRVVPTRELASDALLVVFEDHNPPAAVPGDGGADLPQAVRPHLERELERVRACLRETLEQHGASTEELQAANEELQAINEELHAAAEELETSREELQSLNEELLTLNQELKAKVKELRRANSDLQNLMASTQIATVFLDERLCIQGYTPAAAALFNLIPADIGRPLSDLRHQLNYELLVADARRVLEELTAVERETCGADGRCFLARFLPYRSLEDRVGGVVLTFVDITERKEVEKALRQSEERFRLLVTGVKDHAIFMLDPEGRVSTWNSGAARLTGYEADEITGRHLGCLYSREEAAAGRPGRMLEEAENEGSSEAEFWQLRQDGSRYWANLVLTAIHGAPGELTGFSCHCRDLTEHKRLEEQARQAQKMEAVGQLAGGVAHDFNNLLTVIELNATTQLRNGALSAADAEATGQILLAAQRAAGLTRQLLTFSRKQVVRMTDLDLNELVHNLMKMLERILGEDIHLEVRSLSPQAVVHADGGMISQLLMNLAVNARDAMPRGGRLAIETATVIVSEADTRINPEVRPGDFVCLTVSDTGQGIAPEHLPRIFEPFFTTKDVGKGTGLGLATVHGIVKQHRGWVTVESRFGEGTTFRTFLPRQTEPAPAPEEPGLPAVALPGGHEAILLVEDEPMVRQVVHGVLQTLGYRVFEAESGPAALQVWREHREEIALLLTDMVMPSGLTGRELAEKVQAEAPDLPVIFTSGYSDDVAGQGGGLAEDTPFLPKPFSPDQLANLIRQVLQTR